MGRRRFLGIAVLGSVFLAGLLLLGAGCAKESADKKEAEEAKAVSLTRGRMEAPGAPMKEKAADKARAGKAEEESPKPTDERLEDGSPENRIKPLLPKDQKEGRERLLEYSVDLGYRCSDFARARLELISIIAKYGFIRSGRTNILDESTMTLHMSIHSRDLYGFLQEVDRIGKLISENIHVSDHTEEMVLSARRARREDLRMARKAAYMKSLSTSRNWQVIESSLEQSENAFDGAEHNKWQISDRVEWAKVTVRLEPLGNVQVPPYKRALYGALNTLLYLGYLLLYLLPWLVLGGLFWWKRERILGIFRRKKGDSGGNPG